MSILAHWMLTEELITGWEIDTPTSWTWQFIYWGVSIQDCATLYVSETNINDINQIDLSTYDSPQTDWWGVAGYYVRGKSIKLKMVIKEATVDLCTAAIGNLKKVMFGQEKDLLVLVLGEYRTCKANLTSFTVTQDDNKKMAFIDIDLRAMEDFHLATNASVSYLGMTSNINPTITNNGEKDTYWQFIFVFSPWNTGITGLTITIDGYVLTLTQALVDGDVLVIDGENKQVLLNTVEIDYDWVVDCKLATGYNVVQIAFTATTLSYDLTEIHRVNFL